MQAYLISRIKIDREHQLRHIYAAIAYSAAVMQQLLIFAAFMQRSLAFMQKSLILQRSCSYRLSCSIYASITYRYSR
jgi:hypothetical protein